MKETLIVVAAVAVLAALAWGSSRHHDALRSEGRLEVLAEQAAADSLRADSALAVVHAARAELARVRDSTTQATREAEERAEQEARRAARAEQEADSAREAARSALGRVEATAGDSASVVVLVDSIAARFERALAAKDTALAAKDTIIASWVQRGRLWARERQTLEAMIASLDSAYTAEAASHQTTRQRLQAAIERGDAYRDAATTSTLERVGQGAMLVGAFLLGRTTP